MSSGLGYAPAVRILREAFLYSLGMSAAGPVLAPPSELEEVTHERYFEIQKQFVSGALTHEQRVDSLNALAWDLRQDSPRHALTLAAETLDVASSLSYPKGVAESLLARSFARFTLANFDAAQGDVERARSLFESLGDSPGLRKAMNLQGMIFGELGRLADALKLFLANQLLCQERHDTRGQADALNNAALMFTYLSDYPNALETYLQALQLYERAGHLEGSARALENIGLTYLEMGCYEAALTHLQRILKSARDKTSVQYAITLMNIGRAFTGIGDLAQALNYSLDSVELFETHSDLASMSYSLDNIGTIYLELGRLGEAHQYLRRALKIKQTVGDRLGQVKTRLYLGQLFSRQGKYELAAKTFHRARKDAQRVGGKAEVYKAHLALAEACEHQGLHTEALHHYKAFLRVKDEVFNKASDHKLQSLRVSHEVEQKEHEKEIYRLKNVELAAANEELRRVKGALERQAQEDALTGLYNRRYLDLRFAEEFKGANRCGTSLAVMICDIDNFKSINDTFSHGVGDKVLVTVARLLRTHVRAEDILARYGGEEFVILMPRLSRAEAVTLCERLRNTIEVYDWQSLQQGLKVTISMGVSSELTAANCERMLALADTKLYEAKQGGKNRVCF